MKMLFAFLIICMFLVFKSVQSQPPPAPTWCPYWPFSKDIDVDQVHIGYGDWCTITEGPHPGIDFGDPNQTSGSMVYSPCNINNYVEWAGCYCTNDNGMVVCVARSEDDWGWGIAHLEEPQYPEQKYNVSGTIPAFEPMEVTSPITQVNWRHIHLYWIERLDPVPFAFGQAYYNPFNYLAGDLIGYDAVCFGSPWYNEVYGNLDENCNSEKGTYLN